MKKLLIAALLLLSLLASFASCKKDQQEVPQAEPSQETTSQNTTSENDPSQKPEDDRCAHEWNTVTTPPTCTAGGYDTKTCALCGESVRENEISARHTYADTYSIDDDYHWFVCTNCNDAKDKALHTLDADGVCTVCQMPNTPTSGVIYTESTDGTYAMVTNYIGTAAKVRIAEEYNGLPVTMISEWAFFCYNDQAITAGVTLVVIPDSVTSIGDAAFYGCINLASVVIPDSVTSIGSYAFNGCSSLTSLEISDSVMTIGANAFGYCFSLENITVKEGNPNYHVSENCLIETASKTLIRGARISTIPTDGSVTSIGDGAFSGSRTLVSLVIPNSVTSIGESAFAGCKELSSVVISDSVTHIGCAVFVQCPVLQNIEVSKGNQNYHVSGNCLIETESETLIQGLKNHVIPSDGSVTSIADYAFYVCEDMTSVVIPDDVTSIGMAAFLGCSDLASVEFGDGMTHIGESAFQYCESLTSLVIPDSVTSIGDAAFYGCTSVTFVVIGERVANIGHHAFFGCDSLTNVYYTGSEAGWQAIGFGNSNDDLTNADIQCNYAPAE